MKPLLKSEGIFAGKGEDREGSNIVAKKLYEVISERKQKGKVFGELCYIKKGGVRLCLTLIAS